MLFLGCARMLFRVLLGCDLAVIGTAEDGLLLHCFSPMGRSKASPVVQPLPSGARNTAGEHSAHTMHVSVGLTGTITGEIFLLTLDSKRGISCAAFVEPTTYRNPKPTSSTSGPSSAIDGSILACFSVKS